MIFSADETTDIGYESGTTVTPDYTARTAGSPARSTGCRSTSAPTTTTTSSTPRNACASPWPGSNAPSPSRARTSVRAGMGGVTDSPTGSRCFARSPPICLTNNSISGFDEQTRGSEEHRSRPFSRLSRRDSVASAMARGRRGR